MYRNNGTGINQNMRFWRGRPINRATSCGRSCKAHNRGTFSREPLKRVPFNMGPFNMGPFNRGAVNRGALNRVPLDIGGTQQSAV